MSSNLSSLPANFSLPEDFPDQTSKPRFNFGEHVCWHPIPAQDFGIITGIEYAPVDHLDDGSWGWRYTVWLDTHSPSHRWTATDIAWEEDLETLPAIPVGTDREVSKE